MLMRGKKLNKKQMKPKRNLIINLRVGEEYETDGRRKEETNISRVTSFI